MDPFKISVQRFNEFAVEYTQRFMNIDSYIPHVDKFCSMVDSIHPSLLELACGPGNFTGYIKKKFPESRILAIDLAPNMIEIAKQQVKDIDFRVMDVRDVSSIREVFNGIMCSFCLPFLSRADTSRLISDCSNLLKENGVIYISTMEGDESMAGFEATSFSGKSEIYFNYHRQSDIETDLNKSGFVINYFKRQDYFEPGGGKLTDMIFIAAKNR